MEIAAIQIVDYILMGILAALLLAQVYFYVRYIASPARKIRRDEKHPLPEMASMPGVSVILCAHNESENLSHYLQALLTQDWSEYEVIVVDDGSEDDTRAVIERYMIHDPRLHMTFVPYGARVQSTKKLALTLAAKAARYDYLLLTDADCVPQSNQWIRHMMQGFRDEQIAIVLGFGPYFEETGHVNRLVRYDTLFNGLHYLGAAISGHPYMGVGRNLAYRKSLFFNSGGFTHMMDNIAGDDDLFVNHVATGQNTAVVTDRDSYVWSIAKHTLQEWIQQKRRHLSVSPRYRGVTKLRLALEPVTRGLFYAMVIATIVCCFPTSLYPLSIPVIVAIAAFLIRWIMQSAIINTAAKRMGLRRFTMWSILWFDIALPLVSLWMLTVPKKNNKKW